MGGASKVSTVIVCPAQRKNYGICLFSVVIKNPVKTDSDSTRHLPQDLLALVFLMSSFDPLCAPLHALCRNLLTIRQLRALLKMLSWVNTWKAILLREDKI